MFFSINNGDSGAGLKNAVVHGDIHIDFDDGWEVDYSDDSIKIYKGYTENFDDLKDDIDYYSKIGNFCVIHIVNNKVFIYHQRYRTFPLFYINNEITNVQYSDYKVEFNSTEVLIINRDISYVKRDLNIDVAPVPFDENYLTVIYDLLYDKFAMLKNTTIPIKLFFSGGLDTGLSMAILNKVGVQYELIDGEYFDQSDIYDSQLKNLIQTNPAYLAYSQLHNYKEKSILVSGTYGDDSFLREPGQLAIFLKSKGINLYGMLNDTHYNYYFFRRDKLKSLFINSYIRRRRDDNYVKNILIKNINSYQHWHIDNTTTFTPFQDINILKIILSLPDDILMDQILNCTINKQLINMFDSSVIPMISQYKNFRRIDV